MSIYENDISRFRMFPKALFFVCNGASFLEETCGDSNTASTL